MTKVLMAVCCVCGVVTRQGEKTKEGYVSHGYCRVHAHYAMNQANMAMEDYYDDKKDKDDK